MRVDSFSCTGWVAMSAEDAPEGSGCLLETCTGISRLRAFAALVSVILACR